MKVEILSKENENEWKNFVENHSESNLYHTVEWKNVIEKTYKYKPFYIMAKGNDKKINGILPMFEVRSIFFGKRTVSLPYSHSVGVLGGNVTVSGLVDFAKKIVDDRGLDYLEIKERPNIKLNGLKECPHYICSFLYLKDSLDILWKNFDKSSVRWGIKKAEKNGVNVVEGKNIEDYKKFYKILLETRKHQGLPAYSFSLFENIYKNLGSNSKLYLAYKDDICIAGLVLLFYKKEVIYAYAASKRRYLNLQPNNLLLWNAIKWSKNNGFDVFDFGITPPEHKNLLLFKSRWGTKNIKVPYYYYLNKIHELPLIDSTSPKFKSMIMLWKMFPIFISKRLGPYLLRHTG
ncbi:MAG: peptidoglycan bridge formation glycyltransferase FemA/FemB family protein [Nanoarchaeota archaeon]|nr:peptidoglycan bridge formation glycyltransferase FemA/FemB family protein [Nanoarchaeota archaeon]MBU1135681.1 peptidoglycan bridge formation glycyltransferase FemA/FemB family protein [Nanoarchaeota archaeon]MBU2520555.1 peptidoglycan bridge formation glycyltransferase FemA/FemB family protein [Nanoarchaeota archaeon]